MRRILFSALTAALTACGGNPKPATPVGEVVPLQSQDAQLLLDIKRLGEGGLLYGGNITFAEDGLRVTQIPGISHKGGLATKHTLLDANSAFMQAAREMSCDQNKCGMIVVPRPNKTVYVTMSTDPRSLCISWDVYLISETRSEIVRRPSCG